MDRVGDGGEGTTGYERDGTPTVAERAHRFHIQLSLRYRVRGESQWRTGITKNISSSGVLFQGEHFAELDAQIELSLTLPAKKPEGPAELICRGTIVRAEVPQGGAPLVTLASRILHYRFMRL